MSARPGTVLAAYAVGVLTVTVVATLTYGFGWGIAAGAAVAFLAPAVPLVSLAAVDRAGQGKHRAPSVRHRADAALAKASEGDRRG